VEFKEKMDDWLLKLLRDESDSDPLPLTVKAQFDICPLAHGLGLVFPRIENVTPETIEQRMQNWSLKLNPSAITVIEEEEESFHHFACLSHIESRDNNYDTLRTMLKVLLTQNEELKCLGVSYPFVCSWNCSSEIVFFQF
jgi:hypothetical protein